MAELSLQEFVDELVAELEDRIEGTFEPTSRVPIERILRLEIARLEQTEVDSNGR